MDAGREGGVEGWTDRRTEGGTEGESEGGGVGEAARKSIRGGGAQRHFKAGYSGGRRVTSSRTRLSPTMGWLGGGGVGG